MNPNTLRRKRLWQEAVQNGMTPCCCWCQKPLSFEEVTVEHLLARSRGGTNDPSNLAIACKPCNNEREDGLPGIRPRGRATVCKIPKKVKRKPRTSIAEKRVQPIVPLEPDYY